MAELSDATSCVALLTNVTLRMPRLSQHTNSAQLCAVYHSKK